MPELESLMRAAIPTRRDLVAELAWRVVFPLLSAGRAQEHLRLFESVVPLGVGDSRVERRMLTAWGAILLAVGRIREATAALERALGALRGDDDHFCTARAWRVRGVIAVQQERNRLATACMRRALNAYARAHDAFGVATVRAQMGLTAMDRADFPRARTLLEMAARERRDARLAPDATVSGALGTIAHLQDDVAQARILYEEALATSATPRERGFALTMLAALSLEAGLDAEAEERATEALAVAERSGDTQILAFVAGIRAILAKIAGRDAEAKATLARASLDLTEHRLARTQRAIEVIAMGLDTGALPTEPSASFEEAIARRVVRRSVGPSIPPERPCLVVAPDVSWFRASGGRDTFIGRRPVARGVLRRLLEAHRDERGKPVAIDDLLVAGWPGVRVRHASALERLYTTIARLRRMGLSRIIVNHQDGYLIAPSCDVVIADEHTHGPV